jgi:hypothetical protein
VKILYIFFRRKKIYCVEWHSALYNIPGRDYVKARDKAHAWKIIKNKNSNANYCEKIYEIE